MSNYDPANGVVSISYARNDPRMVMFSDDIGSNVSPNWTTIPAGYGSWSGDHLYQGNLMGSALAFVDGHVELRSYSAIRQRNFYGWNFGY